MAKQANVNLTPATGAVAIYDLKTFLVGQLGATVMSSSDGSTYNASGDQISHGGSGAGGMGNNSAWFRIRLGDYEWTFQRGTTDLVWRVKYSALDRFTGGSPGATQTPSAADEQVMHGGGTDASPTYSTLFAANGSYRWHLSGYDVAVVGVFPWYAWSAQNGTGTPQTLICHEALDEGTYPALVGTRASPTTGEADPSIQVCSYQVSGNAFLWVTSSGWQGSAAIPRAWWCYNGTNGQTEAWGSVAGAVWVNSTSGSQEVTAPVSSLDGYGVDARSGQDLLGPIPMGRWANDGSRTGPKGTCKYLRWKSIYARAYPDCVDVGTDRYCYAMDLAIPFADGVTPLT